MNISFMVPHTHLEPGEEHAVGRPDLVDDALAVGAGDRRSLHQWRSESDHMGALSLGQELVEIEDAGMQADLLYPVR